MTVALLTACFVMPTIARVNRWVILFGVRFQPSELLKLLLVAFLAGYLEDKQDVYEALVRVQVRLQRPGEAFAAAERLRAQAQAEVRARRSAAQGGAAASVGTTKQRALVFAAQHYLMRCAVLPPCRFDVVAIDGDTVDWLPAAFGL